ncbi:MAG: serine/threonine-protein kinase, partial [Candidatus Eremiobacterota bacterium]
LLGQVLWSLRYRDPGSGPVLRSVPMGAGVYRAETDLFLPSSGPSVAGVRWVLVGRTPGPFQITEGDFPVDLKLRLFGYRELRQRFEEPPRQAVRLEPAVPVLVPVLYLLRDYAFAATAALLALWLARGVARSRRASLLDREVRERHRRGDFQPGDRVGAYRLRRFVARGGMALVYEASREDEAVALKLLLNTGPELRQRFAHEVRLLQKLRHPNLVWLYDWGEEEGHLFLVMEFLRGATLEQTVLDERPAPEQALRWAVTLGEALREIHRLGIVHRDVKPANVMVTQTGLKLMDFGVARGAAGTGVEGRVGTPGWMAPEQIRGEFADWRSDAYALGAVLFFALAGHGPFEAETALATLELQQAAPPSELPEPAADLLGRLLQPDPERRGLTDEDGLVAELRALAE